MSSPPPRPLILIVDDDARTARMLARMLTEDGYTAELVFDGAAAIGRLGRSPAPDVLITDITMPYADGRAVARYAQSRRAHLPVFIVTGYPELTVELERTLDPAPEVFAKPLDYATLSRRLRELTSPQPLTD